MSIDSLKEFVFRLAEANDHSPGKPVSRNAWMRRALKGINVNGRNVRLETFLVGRDRYTSKEAIQRWIDAQNDDGPSIPAVQPAGPRQPQSDAARRELAEMGV